MSNRQAVEAQILSDLELISPGCIDTKLYREYFSKMSDKDFEAFISRLENKEEWITITVPNLGKNNLSIERNHEIAKKWGHDFYRKLWMPETDETPAYLTPNKFLVLRLPVRIASQRLAKKMSIPKHQRIINSLTGQPTGDSKGASFSMPELRLCVGMGLEKTAIEFMKYRGGDMKGYMALSASLMRYGVASQETLKHFASGVVSTKTIKTYFTSAHLSNTL